MCVAGLLHKGSPCCRTPTLAQLHTSAPACRTGWTDQQQHADVAALPFDERFGLLVDAEWLARDNKRVARALQEAKLKLPQASVEAIDYPARRELDKAVIRQLASCRWIDEHQQVLVTGATGTGKSFIACALAHHACRRAIVRLPAASRLSTSQACPARRYLRRSRKLPAWTPPPRDWGLSPVQIRSGAISSDPRVLLRRSTIVTATSTRQCTTTSERPADAICVGSHHAHRIGLKDPHGRSQADADRPSSVASPVHDRRSTRSPRRSGVHRHHRKRIGVLALLRPAHVSKLGRSILLHLFPELRTSFPAPAARCAGRRLVGNDLLAFPEGYGRDVWRSAAIGA